MGYGFCFIGSVSLAELARNSNTNASLSDKIHYQTTTCTCEIYVAGEFTESDLTGCVEDSAVCPVCTTDADTMCECVNDEWCFAFEVSDEEENVIAGILILLGSCCAICVIVLLFLRGACGPRHRHRIYVSAA